MAERMTTPEDVKSCYRLLLGRDPESYEVLIQWTQRCRFQKDLIKAFIESQEFRNRFGDEISIKKP